MAKVTKVSIEKMTPQEAMALINELGLPEGTGEEMRATLLEHFGFVAD